MKLICFLICLYLGSFANAQTVTGFYKMFYLKNVDAEKLSKDAEAALTYSYVYDKRKSLQRLIFGGGTVIKDTLIVDEYGKTHDVVGKINKPKDAFFYKSFDEDKLRIQFALDNSVRAIKDTIPNYKWSFHNDSKEILGYICKKATTIANKSGIEQNITAWYTPDIPISDGPLDYSGLPGLILELEIDVFSLVRFENLKLFTEKSTIINEPESTVPTLTMSQYNMIYGRKN